MNNGEYDELLENIVEIKEKYDRALREAEDEFEERYGLIPAEEDINSWIDSYHYSAGFRSIKEIEADKNETGVLEKEQLEKIKKEKGVNEEWEKKQR